MFIQEQLALKSVWNFWELLADMTALWLDILEGFLVLFLDNFLQYVNALYLVHMIAT